MLFSPLRGRGEPLSAEIAGRGNAAREAAAGLRGVLPSAPVSKMPQIVQVHAMNVAHWQAVKWWSVADEDAQSSEVSETRMYDVLLVITHLTPGGSLEVLNLMAEELRKQGLSVRTVALYRGSP